MTNRLQHFATTNATRANLPQPAWVFLVVWLVLGLVQASFTELTSDEGYYWFYAQRLQWGYYDHPPLVALLVKAGVLLLPGELGVRFFLVVFSAAGLYLFLRLLPVELLRQAKTYVVLLAAPLLHYLGFLVFPDSPLLFTSLLFLFLYRRFLQGQTWPRALWLGLALAAMAYAKYHGALVLLLVVAANPRLLRSVHFYGALLVAAALFAPHLWWQYANDFPTFRYHLSGRTGSWSFRYLGEYLSQQIAAIGPAFIFLPFAIRTKDLFERTLKFIALGTLLFFLLSAFKTFVHFHWTSIALYPLLYFAVGYYNRPQKRKLFNLLVLPFAVLFLLARLLLVLPLFPNLHVGEDYYQGRKAWAQGVKSLAGERPVFIPNNLREASLYSFYSGGGGVTLYTRPEKKSQYELWGYEDSLQGKEVLLLTRYPHEGSSALATTLAGNYYYSVVPAFRSYYNNVLMEVRQHRVNGDTLLATLLLHNTGKHPIQFRQANGNSAALAGFVFQGRNFRRSDALLFLGEKDNLAPGQQMLKNVMLPLKGLAGGGYTIAFGIRSGVLPEAVLTQGSTFILQKEADSMAPVLDSDTRLFYGGHVISRQF